MINDQNKTDNSYIMKKNIAITIRSFGLDPDVMDLLHSHVNITFKNTSGKRLLESDLARSIQNAAGVIAGTEQFSSQVIAASGDLRVISRVGVGTDSIDLDAASKRDIRIFTTPAATVQPVAEHTLALILSLMKKTAEYHETVKKGEHKIKEGSLLYGKDVGIVGLGRIGFRVAELLSCIGCTICYFDPFFTTLPPPSWKKMQSLHELLANVDIITLHTPSLKDNLPVLNREAFNQCRHGVLVINTARGSLVDESALSDALSTGRVAGAGLDVTIKEPYEGPLLAFPQVILTPHVASNTIESRKAMEMEAVENIIKGLEEEGR